MRYALVIAAVLVTRAAAATLTNDGGTLVYTAGAPAPDPKHAVINLYHPQPDTVVISRHPGDDDWIDAPLSPGCLDQRGGSSSRSGRLRRRRP